MGRGAEFLGRETPFVKLPGGRHSPSQGWVTREAGENSWRWPAKMSKRY